MDRLIKLAEVQELTGLKHSAIYRRMRDGEFPTPRKISTQAVRWHLSEVKAWIEALPRAEGLEAEAAA